MYWNVPNETFSCKASPMSLITRPIFVVRILSLIVNPPSLSLDPSRAQKWICFSSFGKSRKKELILKARIMTTSWSRQESLQLRIIHQLGGSGKDNFPMGKKASHSWLSTHGEKRVLKPITLVSASFFSSWASFLPCFLIVIVLSLLCLLDAHLLGLLCLLV